MAALGAAAAGSDCRWRSMLRVAAAVTVLVVLASAAPSASAPRCTITGTPGRDVLVGTARHDVICGLGGNDLLDGGLGNDVLDGGAGSDVLLGGPGNDLLRAWDGTRDRIDGGPGRDHAWVDPSVDRVSRVEKYS